MIKVFSGKWRGLGADDDKGLGMMLDFRFREVLHEFKGAKLAVFMAIALHSDENGFAYPSYDLLDKETGYGRDTIARALDSLCITEINGQRVLMRYRERDESGQFSGSNRYRIFPTAAELADESLPQLDFPTMENTNSGKSNLKINHSNKNNQSLSKDQIHDGASAAVCEPTPLSENGNGHRTAAKKKGDLLDGTVEYSQKAQGRVDVGAYPEDVHAVIERFCQKFGFTPPPANGKEAKDWILSAQVIAGMPGFTLDVIDAIADAKDRGKLEYKIYRPGSIIKECRRLIAEQRKVQEAANALPGGWTPEALEAMKEKIRQLQAQRATDRAAGEAAPA